MNSTRDVMKRQRRGSFASFVHEPNNQLHQKSSNNQQIEEDFEEDFVNFEMERRRRVTKKLPQNFEKTIIELELSLEKGQANQELIAQLLTLYSNGVEHYDSVGDQKAASIYRDKIHILFMKPIVIQEYTLMIKKASNHQDESNQQKQVQKEEKIEQETPKIVEILETKNYRKKSKDDSSIEFIFSQEQSQSSMPKEDSSFGYDTPQRQDTIIRIDNIMDKFLEQKEKSQVVLQQEQQQQQNALHMRLLQRNQSRQESKKSLFNKSHSTLTFNNNEQSSAPKNNKRNSRKIAHSKNNSISKNQDTSKLNYFNLTDNQSNNSNATGRQGNSMSTANLNTFNFNPKGQINMNDISFINQPNQINLLNQNEMQTSIIIQDSNSNQNQLTEEVKLPILQNNKVSTDEELISYKESSQSHQSAFSNLQDNNNTSDDMMSLENNEEYKQAELSALESFVEKKNSELANIHDKYQHQVKQLELRGVNPLTKKLIEKVKKEWEEAIKKKELELEEEKSALLLQISEDFKNKKLLTSEEIKNENQNQINSSDEDLLNKQQIQVVINDKYISSKDSSPFKIIDHY